VSCSRLFSRKEIFCFCAALPPVSSESISALCENKVSRSVKTEKLKGHNYLSLTTQTHNVTLFHLQTQRIIYSKQYLYYLFNSGSQVLNKELAQIVQSLKFFCLEFRTENFWNSVFKFRITIVGKKKFPKNTPQIYLFSHFSYHCLFQTL
jgi:hypothetical protein